MPEYLVAMLVTAVLGWGSFTWRRADKALDSAERANDRTDKLELKVAENYLSKAEFQQRMDELFSTLTRFENKIDNLIINTRHSRRDLDD